jgi:solute carrier family 25 phosphate transporter 23/24/25/41
MDQNTMNFINAGFAGMISRTATAPLERIKVMYQNKSNIKTSYYSYIPKLIKKEGYFSLFNGNGINCIRVVPESAIRYGVFDYSKKYFKDKGFENNINYFISGSISGIIASCTVYPLETIRTKITAQSNNNMYNDYLDCVKKSFNKSGIRGFYKGNVLYTLGMIPYQGTNFLTYEYLKNNYENTHFNLLLFGSIAGFTSISCSYPFEIIKRRMQLSGELGNPTYKDTWHCLRHMYSQNGLRAFYAGLIPQYIKLIPANCIFFYTIEVFKSVK